LLCDLITKDSQASDVLLKETQKLVKESKLKDLQEQFDTFISRKVNQQFYMNHYANVPKVARYILGKEERRNTTQQYFWLLQPEDNNNNPAAKQAMKEMQQDLDKLKTSIGP
jgi:hypothetical protein